MLHPSVECLGLQLVWVEEWLAGEEGWLAGEEGGLAGEEGGLVLVE